MECKTSKTIPKHRMESYIVYCLHYAFSDSAHREVFKYNYYLFGFGVLVFVVGAIVETFVLGNVTILSKVYMAAFAATL